ncbi:MAG: hypothetical protein ACLFPM_04990 [Candidatus Izemoplasmatales bacterium]
MKRIIFATVTFMIVTALLMAYNTVFSSDPVFSSNTRDILYSNSSGDKEYNLSANEYDQFFYDGKINIVVIFDVEIEESYILDELSKLENHEGNSRQMIINNYYELRLEEVVREIGIETENIKYSRYTPFIWIDITSMDYDNVTNLIDMIMENDYVLSLTVAEDVIQVPLLEE